jgi:uncharacterized protein
MSFSPLAYADSLRIGIIDFVSPAEIKVLLDIDAPDSVALNTGSPRPFPRINSYVLIPSDQGYLVGQVEWITVERSQYPKRKGMQDFGLIDLPYPLRKMCLNPLGSLFYDGKDENDVDCYVFRRGVEAFPSVGDPVMLPTQHQLRSIVESGGNRRVKIGISPLAGNADVKIDPDRLFGRHLAVLGNTGSGKSCSVAGLIRWSLEEAEKKCEKPNARFIILDPNGEYAHAFKDSISARIFAVEPTGTLKQLQAPLWFWNTNEWSAFTQATSKTQKPTLIHSLRSVRDGKIEAVLAPSKEMRRFLRTIVYIIQQERNSGSPWGKFPLNKNFNEKIKKWNEKGLLEDDLFTEAENLALKFIKEKIDEFTSDRSGKYPDYDFSKIEIDELLCLAKRAHVAFGGTDVEILPIDADIPREFTGDALLRSIDANADMLNVSEYVETMILRIRTMLSDSKLKTIIGDTDGVTLDGWLNDYIGQDLASNGTVTVIDLSLVPTDVVHLVAAVIARITFEALQRYRKLHDQKKTLPTVLVMEEAHTFIKRYKDDAENYDAAAVCCQVFEKIAREGRKYGLGLVLSSQRPSELSPTVLSQCNSFLLHRISNDRDQELVQKLVPDNLHGLLRDLPSLPTRNAILLGWASELPILVQMNTIPEQQRPKSDDPDFWSVWTGKSKDDLGKEVDCQRSVDWKIITDDWQQVKSNLTPDCSCENKSEESDSEPDE